MGDYEAVVDTIVSLYNDKFKEWSVPDSMSYFRSKSAPDDIYQLTQALASVFEPVLSNSYILDWRATEEWPESRDATIVYSLVNLLIQQKTDFLPNDLRQFILEQPREDKEYRVELLKNIYGAVYNNISRLNDAIVTNELPVSEILGPQSSTLARLYNTTSDIYIYSGVKDVVFSNDQLYEFMNIHPTHFSPLRSWTIDLRVAMQFTAEDDVNARVDKRFSDRAFRVIFMTKKQDICYVSPESSWEAEVLVASGDYRYGGHFVKEIPFLNPPYTTAKEPKQFLFIVIERITNVSPREMNQLQFKKMIEEIYTNHLKDKEMITYGLDMEDEEEEVGESIRSFKRKRGGKRTKRAKKRTKKRTKGVKKRSKRI